MIFVIVYSVFCVLVSSTVIWIALTDDEPPKLNWFDSFAIGFFFGFLWPITSVIVIREIFKVSVVWRFDEYKPVETQDQHL